MITHVDERNIELNDAHPTIEPQQYVCAGAQPFAGHYGSHTFDMELKKDPMDEFIVNSDGTLVLPPLTQQDITLPENYQTNNIPESMLIPGQPFIHPHGSSNGGYSTTPPPQVLAGSSGRPPLDPSIRPRPSLEPIVTKREPRTYLNDSDSEISPLSVIPLSDSDSSATISDAATTITDPRPSPVRLTSASQPLAQEILPQNLLFSGVNQSGSHMLVSDFAYNSRPGISPSHFYPQVNPLLNQGNQMFPPSARASVDSYVGRRASYGDVGEQRSLSLSHGPPLSSIPSTHGQGRVPSGVGEIMMTVPQYASSLQHIGLAPLPPGWTDPIVLSDSSPEDPGPAPPKPTAKGAFTRKPSFPGHSLFSLDPEITSYAESVSPSPTIVNIAPTQHKSRAGKPPKPRQPTSTGPTPTPEAGTSTPSADRPVAPKSRGGRPPKKSKTAASKIDNGGSSRIGGVYVPAGLVNPFSKRPPTGGREEIDLSDDMNLIRVGKLERDRELGTLDEKSMQSEINRPMHLARRGSAVSIGSVPSNSNSSRVKDTSGKSPPRPSTRSGSAKQVSPEDYDEVKTQHNDDHCSACLGRGRLLCCDSCPRAFHFLCVEEGFECIEDVPEDSWECRACRAKKRSPSSSAKKGKKTRTSPNSSPPTGNNNTKSLGLFEQLLDTLDCTNPRVFELPREIVRSVEHAYVHPATGAYVDTREVEVIKHNKGIKMGRKGANSTNTNTSNSNGNGTGEAGRRCNDASHTCFKCGKSGFKIYQTSFLSSHSVPQPTLPTIRLQAIRTELVKCDYCPLYWHLDCLDPPLTSIPPELKDDEKEVVDVGSCNSLRIRTWGSASAIEADRNGSVDEDGGGKKAASHGGKADTGLVHLRRKWMCPCHVDWSLPKLKINSGWKWVEITAEPPKAEEADVAVAGEADSLKRHASEDLTGAGKKPRTTNAESNTEPGSSVTPLPAPMLKKPSTSNVITTTSSQNNGYIEVVNDVATEEYFARTASNSKKQNAPQPQRKVEETKFADVKYKLPERRIKLEFIERVNSMKELINEEDDGRKRILSREMLIRKFGGVGRGFRSFVEELYSKASADVLEGRGAHGKESVLGYAAAVVENGVADKFAGTVRATDEEAEEWLQAVTMMQSEVAYLLNMRRAANAYKAVTSSNTDKSNTHMTVDVRDKEGSEKDVIKDEVGNLKVENAGADVVTDGEKVDAGSANGGENQMQDNDVNESRVESMENKNEDVVILKRDDPEWIAFCKWKEGKGNLVECGDL